MVLPSLSFSLSLFCICFKPIPHDAEHTSQHGLIQTQLNFSLRVKKLPSLGLFRRMQVWWKTMFLSSHHAWDMFGHWVKQDHVGALQMEGKGRGAEQCTFLTSDCFLALLQTPANGFTLPVSPLYCLCFSLEVSACWGLCLCSSGEVVTEVRIIWMRCENFGSLSAFSGQRCRCCHQTRLNEVAADSSKAFPSQLRMWRTVTGCNG